MVIIQLNRTGARLANRLAIHSSRAASRVLTELASIIRAISLLSNGWKWAESPSYAKPFDPTAAPKTSRHPLRGGKTLPRASANTSGDTLQHGRTALPV